MGRLESEEIPPLGVGPDIGGVDAVPIWEKPMNHSKGVMSLLLAGASLFLSSARAQGPDYSICATPLNSALKTIQTSNTGNSQSSASTAWQCSFKFSNHDQALAAGLNVGAVVYGVPLKVGGTWNQTDVNTWKDENCSKSTQAASFESATMTYLEQVAPGAFDAFSSCVANLHNTSALVCSIDSNNALTVKWRRNDGQPAADAPIVSSFTVANGSCTPALTAGTAIKEGGNGSICTPIAKKTLIAMTETNVGVCKAVIAYKKTVYPIPASLYLTADKTLTSDVVQFSNNAKIVTNGYALKIQAGELAISGDSKIMAFDTSGPVLKTPGEDGRSAGTVIIQAGNITGSTLTIDLTGEDGANGVKGPDGTQGPKGGDAAPRGLQGIHGCGGGHEASPGGVGYPGGAGQNGGNGGAGGVVLLTLSPDADQNSLSLVNVIGRLGKTAGGKGGKGGAGGIGGPGGPGGNGAAGHDGCGNRGGAGPGPQGPNGAQGTAGKDGVAGSYSIN